MRQLKDYVIVTHDHVRNTYEVEGYDEHGHRHDLRGVVVYDERTGHKRLITFDGSYLLVNPA